MALTVRLPQGSRPVPHPGKEGPVLISKPPPLSRFPPLMALTGEGRGGLPWKRPQGGSLTRNHVVRFTGETWLQVPVLGLGRRNTQHPDPTGKGRL